MEQLILHLLGDYVNQPYKMATMKTKSWSWAVLHALIYALPFFLLGNVYAVAIILITHAVIDRYSLLKYKQLPESAPEALRIWLPIIADNTGHLTMNYLALRFF